MRELLSISASGIVTFNATPDFEALADADDDNVFEVTVHAIDNGVHDVARDLRITVTDTNDLAPVFSSGTTGIEAENTAAASIVYTAQASDADATPAFSTIQYSLQSGGDNSFFTIDGSTGEVRFNASPDFEAAHGPTYNIVVIASDGVPAHDATRSVAISVTDLNDNAPVFDSAATTDSKPEGALYSFNGHATDLDGTAPNNQIVYSLSGEDAADFSINSSGVVAYIGLGAGVAPDFEAPTDLNLDNVYKITINATDGGAPANNTARNLEITITDNADIAPDITSGAIGATVTEGTAPSTVVYTTAVTPSSGVTFSLTGADSGFFDVSAAGEVTFQLAPNFETHTGVYSINVIASNSAGSDSQAVTVTVTDVAPNALGDATGSVTEGDATNASAGITGSTTDFFGATASDLVHYSLTNDAGGRFKVIDNGDGTFDIQVGPNASLINYETSGASHKYTITVSAFTTNGTAATSKSYDITVGDVTPPAPTDNDASTNRISTSAAAGTPVGIMAFANDVNGGPLTYSFATVSSVLQDGGGRFDIDPATGVITLKSGMIPPLGNIGDTHTVKVQATSDGINFSPASADFTITVANDVPTVDLDLSAATFGYAANFVEGAAAIPIADTDITITDPVSTVLVSATIKLTNKKVGDTLTAGAGCRPGSMHRLR